MTPQSNHTITSPPRPTHPTTSAPDMWGPYASSRSFFSNMLTILVILVCISILAFSLHAVARLLRRRLSARRAARPLPKPQSDAADNAVAVTVCSAGGWAEAECAICLFEFADGERVRVLPACGHGFHAACVEGWLAARASCPTCRAPAQPSVLEEP